MKKVIQLFVCLSLIAVLCSCGTLSALSIGLTTLYEDSRMPDVRPTDRDNNQRKQEAIQHVNSPLQVVVPADSDTGFVSGVKMVNSYLPYSNSKIEY